MIAVFEEVNGEFAVFLVGDLSRTYNLHLSLLPKDAQPGDLFEVEINSKNELKLGQELINERNRRIESNRLKREALKKRHNSNQ